MGNWAISADEENNTWIYNSDSSPCKDTIGSVENDCCGNTTDPVRRVFCYELI
jgi:hypothetical protein